MIEYDGAQKAFSRLKMYLLQKGPLDVELENGRVTQDTAAAADRAVEDAFWIIAYICKRFGGELMWRRATDPGSRNRIQARAQHILRVLQVMKPESGGAETVMNVLHIWRKLEFLLLDALRSTPLSGSLLKAPWYWKYVLSLGPAEVLAAVQHLRHGSQSSDFHLFTSIEISRMGSSHPKAILEEFYFFIHADMLLLAVNHLHDLRPRRRVPPTACV